MTHDTMDHASPQPTSETFVPEAEVLESPEEFQPSFESPTEPEVITQPTIPSSIPPIFCRINLKDGCYRITYKPNSELHTYNGTLRVDRAEGNTTISGDLYQFSNPILTPHPSLSDLIEDDSGFSPVTPPIPIPHIPFGIPVYPRRQYYSYLKVVGIQIDRRVLKCNLILTVQEYRYTLPPVGSFDGSFPTSPSRTFKLVLSPRLPPFGFTSSYFEGKLYEGGIEKGSFYMGWVSKFFRKATLEIAVLQGAVSPQPVPAAGGSGTEDFRTVFASCGWDMNAVINTAHLAVPPGVDPNSCWTEDGIHYPKLHDLMTTTVHSTDTHLDKVWHLHVLVVPGTMGCGRGVMFDTIGVPREGVASFCNDGYPSSDSSNFGTAANQRQQNVPRAFLRSVSHEVGHGFNQIHQNVTSEGEPGSDNSIMTTTPEVADVLGGPASGDPGVFPTDITLRFNRHVRHHLVHFPDITVRPGGMSFGAGHNTTVPQSDRNRHFFAPEQLELKISLNAKRVKLGQPLQVDWQIINNSKVNIPLPNNVSIEAQHTYITIYDPNGHSKLMKSFVIQTDTVKMQELKPGDKVESSTMLFWSSNGFAFETPGRHIIELKTIWNYGGVQYGVKTTSEVWCDYPVSDKDNEVASLLLHQDVGKFIALGGGASHLEEAVSRIEKVKSDYSDHPAHTSIMNLERRTNHSKKEKSSKKK